MPMEMTTKTVPHTVDSEAFATWAAGYGMIRHEERTRARVCEMAERLVQRGLAPNADAVFRILAAADRLASAGMWLVVHMTYARSVYLDGRELVADDFKARPEGHTGGALNMVPAYVGYLAANALSGFTRGWLMGQGHCVAAIDAINVLVGNMSSAHAARYDASDEGLTRLVRDFYSYALSADGRPESPLGSHVNAHTAGGLSEGGYLGFAELEYVHMPLQGERLVAFLSDGAFEEQRGSDWAPRWWRAEDCGLVAPIMIANGRRIDQRTTTAQVGGVDWLRDHLRLNGFEPIDVDGRDPADLAWSIVEMDQRLEGAASAVASGDAAYPVRLPYAIAETTKGFGFPGADTNRAHNLPLAGNPSSDAAARSAFCEGAGRLWVSPLALATAAQALCEHERQGRPRERDNALATRQVLHPVLSEPPWRPIATGLASPVAGIDECFARIVEANPALRPRVGNPDEMSSNRMLRTLALLKHRVAAPETGVAESLHGGVITALNEEAVACAALANKGGISLVVTYEAFAVKMLGAVRQELIFARSQREAGRAPGWLSVPIILTSHTWENGKNEQSHQDPTFCEALLGEMADTSRVVFPPDWNTAVATLQAVYRTHGQIWSVVVPKNELPIRFSPEQADELVVDGALRLRGEGTERVTLVAVGGYQLEEALRASTRLTEKAIPHAVVYLFEPARFRVSRDSHEAAVLASDATRERLFPRGADVRVLLTHTRPEPLLGALRPLDTGPGTRALGYINRGGTLDVAGMLRTNRCTWIHAVAAVADGLERAPAELLDPDELLTLDSM